MFSCAWLLEIARQAMSFGWVETVCRVLVKVAAGILSACLASSLQNLALLTGGDHARRDI